MTRKVSVNNQGYLYLPKDIRDNGFEGDLDAMPNHFTVAIFKPGSTLRQRKQSLEVLIHDLEVQLGERK